MTTRILDQLARIDVPPAEADRLGLDTGRLHLRRAWPRTADHLLLEYTTANGRIVPGQWQRKQQRIADAFGALPHTSRAFIALPAPHGAVGLQLHGADTHLPGLGSLLTCSQAGLLVHQPGRRAVVRLDAAGQVFAKVLRPERTAAMAAAGQVAAALSRGHFATPQLLACDEQNGVLRWSGLPGVSLDALPTRAAYERGAYAAGTALRALHAAPPPAAATIHGPNEEVQVLEQWITRTAPFDPVLSRRVAARLPAVSTALLATAGEVKTIHRDFYDKQILISAGERVGLLDFDTLACGEPALDLANMLVHIQLRALQGLIDSTRAQAAAAAFLAGYNPPPAVRARLTVYAAASRLRLACVYALRPRWRHCCAALLALTPLV